MSMREDYLARKITFSDYYREVNRLAGVRVDDEEFLQRVREALAMGDAHLNSIPVTTWDSKVWPYKEPLREAFKTMGDFWSLAGGVCAMKQAALDAVKEPKS